MGDDDDEEGQREKSLMQSAVPRASSNELTFKFSLMITEI